MVNIEFNYHLAIIIKRINESLHLLYTILQQFKMLTLYNNNKIKLQFKDKILNNNLIINDISKVSLINENK